MQEVTVKHVVSRVRFGALMASVVMAALVFAGSASAQRVVVPKGTPVDLAFDSAFSSKTAKVGDVVPLHVTRDVVVRGHTIIRKGTRVTAVISDVSKRKRYGVNAKIQLALNPVNTTFGRSIPLEPRSQGRYVGRKTGGAAAATLGGAALLGPVGLVGGYFISGRSVNVKPGDPLATEVSKSVVLRRR
jgi:hypothetical protein